MYFEKRLHHYMGFGIGEYSLQKLMDFRFLVPIIDWTPSRVKIFTTPVKVNTGRKSRVDDSPRSDIYFDG